MYQNPLSQAQGEFQRVFPTVHAAMFHISGGFSCEETQKTPQATCVSHSPVRWDYCIIPGTDLHHKSSPLKLGDGQNDVHRFGGSNHCVLFMFQVGKLWFYCLCSSKNAVIRYVMLAGRCGNREGEMHLQAPVWCDQSGWDLWRLQTVKSDSGICPFITGFMVLESHYLAFWKVVLIIVLIVIPVHYPYSPHIQYYSSSSRASRGRKFQKKKELYSKERICL